MLSLTEHTHHLSSSLRASEEPELVNTDTAVLAMQPTPAQNVCCCCRSAAGYATQAPSTPRTKDSVVQASAIAPHTKPRQGPSLPPSPRKPSNNKDLQDTHVGFPPKNPPWHPAAVVCR
jgi:hypothetical protein